jgi:hypothetical protein
VTQPNPNSPSCACAAESEAFLRLCEALGIPATSCAHLEGVRLVRELESIRAQLAFILEHGQPMRRDGKFRYHGVTEPVWRDTPQEAIEAAMREFPAHVEDVGAVPPVTPPPAPSDAAADLRQAVDAVLRVPLCGSEGKLLIPREKGVALWSAFRAELPRTLVAGSLYTEYLAAVAKVLRSGERTSQDKVIVAHGDSARLRAVHNEVMHAAGAQCLDRECEPCAHQRPA